MWHSSNLAFNLVAMLTQGAIEAIELRGTPALEAALSREDGGRHVDRHDEPHRAAGGLRSRRRAHARRAAGRRHVQALRPEDLHHLRRARLHREHRPPGARAHAGRARGRQGHLAFRRAEVPGQRRRQPRRAQRRPLRLARAQARHPREPDGRDGVWRPRRRDRLSRGRGEPRPRVHVHHDEPRALLRRDGRRRHLRARLPARGGVREGARAGPGGRQRPRCRRRPRSSSIRTSGGC